MASVTLPIKIKSDGSITVPITFTNPKNNKSVTLDTLPDTGWTRTTLEPITARELGIALESGRRVTGASNIGYYGHELFIKVGNLTPVRSQVQIPSSRLNVSLNILGMAEMHKFYKIIFNKNSITFQDRPTTTTAALAVVAMMQQQSNSAAHWRNRI
jgi:hypothetical protein